MEYPKVIPALNFWPDEAIKEAINNKTVFAIPSGLGGIFDAHLIQWNEDGTGRFKVTKDNQHDFGGTEMTLAGNEVTKAYEPIPELGNAEDLEFNARLRHRNDLFRSVLPATPMPHHGKIVMTEAIAGMEPADISELLLLLMTFKDFKPGEDIDDRHERGSFTYKEETYQFVIDYYDANYEYASPNPLNDKVTRRLLTLMTPDDL